MKQSHRILLQDLFEYIIPRKYYTLSVQKALLERFSRIEDLLYYREELLDLFPSNVGNKVLTLCDVLLEFCIRTYYVPAGVYYKESTQKSFIRMARLRVYTPHRERIYALFFTKKLKYIGLGSVAIGSENVAVFDIKTILEKMLQNKSEKIILVHNHPTGSITPSPEDLYATASIKESLLERDYALIDHWIVTQKQAYSIFQDAVL